MLSTPPVWDDPLPPLLPPPAANAMPPSNAAAPAAYAQGIKLCPFSKLVVNVPLAMSLLLKPLISASTWVTITLPCSAPCAALSNTAKHCCSALHSPQNSSMITSILSFLLFMMRSLPERETCKSSGVFPVSLSIT